METKNPIITTSFEQETLYINKPYLESIVLNLMTNALKYSKENIKPEINVSTKLKNNKIEIKLLIKNKEICKKMEINSFGCN